MKFLKFLGVVAFFTTMMVACSKTDTINPTELTSDAIAATRGDSTCDTTKGGHGGPGRGGNGGGGPKDTIKPPKNDTNHIKHDTIRPFPRDTTRGGGKGKGKGRK